MPYVTNEYDILIYAKKTKTREELINENKKLKAEVKYLKKLIKESISENRSK